MILRMEAAVCRPDPNDFLFTPGLACPRGAFDRRAFPSANDCTVDKVMTATD